MKKLLIVLNFLKIILSLFTVYLLGVVLLYAGEVFSPFCFDFHYIAGEKFCSSFLWRSIAVNLILQLVMLLCVVVMRFFQKSPLWTWASILPDLFFAVMFQWALSVEAISMHAVGPETIVNRSDMSVSTINIIVVSGWAVCLFLVCLYFKRKNRSNNQTAYTGPE